METVFRIQINKKQDSTQFVVRTRLQSVIGWLMMCELAK